MAERSKRSGSKWRPLRFAAGALLLFGLALLVGALFISATPLGEAAFGLVILGVPTMAAGGLLWWLEGVDAKAKAGDKSRRRRRRRRSLGESSRFTPSEQMSMSPSELGPVTLVGFDAEADPDLDPAVPFRPSMADWTLSRPAPLSPAPMPRAPAVSLPFRRSAPVPFRASSPAPLQNSAPMPLQARPPIGPLDELDRLDSLPLHAQPHARGGAGVSVGEVAPLMPAPFTPRSAPLVAPPLSSAPTAPVAPVAASAKTSPSTPNALNAPLWRDAPEVSDGVSVPYRRGAEITAALRQPTPPSARVPVPLKAAPERTATKPAVTAPTPPLPTLVPVLATPATPAMGATLRQLPPMPPLPAPVPARAATPLSLPPRPQSWQVPPLPLAPLQLPPMVVPPLPMPMSMPPMDIAPLPLPPLVLPPLMLPPMMLPPLPYAQPAANEGASVNDDLHPEPTGWSAAMLGALHWRRFEAVVETLYRQAGFRVRTQPHGSHGGLHIWLYSRHQVGPPVSVVRCERGHGVPVGVALLRELSGVMFAQGARRGHFVSGAGFTVEAHNYAKRHGIHVLDVPGLLALILARSAEQQHALLEAAQERP